MEANYIPLAQVVKFYSGLIGLNGKDSIVISDKPFDYSPEKYGKLIPSGRYLQRYKVTFTGEYIRRDKRLYKSGFDEKKYLSPKIFLNQTGDSFKACFDDQGYFCLNNMHIGYPVSQIYDLRFVNAILCSKLMNFYYHAISLEFGRAMAQIDIETIDQLPLPKVNNNRGDLALTTPKFDYQIKNLYQEWQLSQSSPIMGQIIVNLKIDDYHNFLTFLVQEIINLLSQQSSLDNETKLSALDHIVDSLINNMYSLSEEEINYIEVV